MQHYKIYQDVNELQYKTFVHEHHDEIIARIKELGNFENTDIAVLKRQILRGINIRKHMPVVPFEEIKQFLVGYIAIKFIEDELEFEL
jgi:hypothetical protein